MENPKICVVGLGYVGLPLLVEFGKLEEVNGFDINKKRIDELKSGIDRTKEVSCDDLGNVNLNFSSDPSIIKESDFVIIAVPTPVDEYNNPDLSILLSASSLVGKNLKKGAVVVYESTVYPGCTERDCVPVLEKESGLKCGEGFKVGYSPERINPGDKVHGVSNIMKLVSGWDKESLDLIAQVYGKIIKAGVYKVSSIKVAEAAKIIENTQRDINIALMNELKMIFDRMDVSWEDVLDAASTKWNFIKFTPGFVGGHCIGVDPYYLAYEAKRLGHHPEIILAGRRINDGMAKYESTRLVKFIINKGLVAGAKVLVLGGAFKPNVPDIRNSKIEDLITELKTYDYSVDICEPFISGDLFGCRNVSLDQRSNYDIVVRAVDHDIFKDVDVDYVAMKSK